MYLFRARYGGASIITALGKPMQEDHKLQARLGYNSKTLSQNIK
jgi:hypothetical protein